MTAYCRKHIDWREMTNQRVILAVSVGDNHLKGTAGPLVKKPGEALVRAREQR